MSKIKLVHEELERYEKSYDDRGWNQDKCLMEWVKLFGPIEIDIDLFKFINNEIKLNFRYNKEYIENLQGTIIKLITFMLHKGMPMKRIENISTYADENKQAINSEKALLIILSAMAKFTKCKITLSLFKESKSNRNRFK
ncbi:MAG: hypothetical protein KAX49_08320 [Halanaerobiales bacterium]|nr:hypothetical protein [Halanaerobiales bacterium]